LAADLQARDLHQRLQAIQLGLEQNQFELYYQPKVDLQSGHCIGVEALIRWQHPELGLLAPGTFLPLIEQHPLGITLGNWVLRRALTQLALWQQ
ncbi:MAG: EAL domain-containing protein, partial [Pseudomonas sp.]